MQRAVPLQRTGGSVRCPRTLRERWRITTLAAGWPFPSDWGVPAVEAVCEAVAGDRNPVEARGQLGRARAESGAELGETLQDLAGLYAVSQSIDAPDVDGVPTRLVRAVALGWADFVHGQIASALLVDGLTGLATAGYLRTRLGEIYRCAEAAGRPAGDRNALVFLSVDLTGIGGWTRMVPMLLAAEAMRAVFTGGETLALAGPSVAAVLCRRDAQLSLRTKRLRRLATKLLAADRDAACAGPVRVWLQRLPPGYAAACDLLAHLSR